MILEVRGVDYECLDGASIDALTKRLESALKLFGDDYRVYQYLFKRNNPAIPHKLYGNAVVDAAIQNRIAYLRSKSDRLFSLSIYYVVLFEGARSARTLGSVLLGTSETSASRRSGNCRPGFPRTNRWCCSTANSSERSPRCCKKSAAFCCRSPIF